MSDPWSKLKEEIARCTRARMPLTFWWRDDDAVLPTDALTRLLDLANHYEIPLALAVIPDQTGEALVQYLQPERRVEVLQHGFAHQNHAQQGQKKSEFPDGRQDTDITADLLAGQQVIDGFSRHCNLFVPPWNRAGEAMPALLASLGFAGISQFGPSGASEAAPGLRRLNTHVDVISWKTTRGFIGLEAAVDAICDHLARRRLKQVHSGEPTGLLTHHLVHDEETWVFIEALFDFSRNYSTINWLPASTAMQW